MKLYIDPGTGSMLFTILIGILGVMRYLLRTWWVKLKTLPGGRAREKGTKKISLAIFSDDKRYWTVFAPICRELAGRHFPVLYLSGSEDDPGLSAGYEGFTGVYIGKGNRGFAKLNFLKTSILLSTTPGLDVYQWKRSRDVDWYVHIPHAASDLSLYRMFGIDFYDAILTSGAFQEEQVRDMEARRNLPAKELCRVGIPYMDEMKKRLLAHPRKEGQGRTVLLAPSWGKSAILSRFGGAIIRDLLATGYHIILRPHPQSFTSERALMDRLMGEFPDSDQLEWNRDSDNFDALNRADILISDFSGVIFEFALVYDKPVIYTDTDFDNAPYDAWWLPGTPWTFSVLPRLGMKLTEETRPRLKEMIDACLMSERFAKGRREAMAECWAYPGEGARRVADYIEGTYQRLTAEGGDGT